MAKRIAITPGDLQGIGPEVTLKALQRHWDTEFTVFSDPNVLRQHAKQLNLESALDNVTLVEATQSLLDPIDQAVKACQSKECDALVTGPIHKAKIIEAGFNDFTGHTEYLKKLDNKQDVLMTFAHKNLRLALMTTHMPLHEVAQAINQDMLINKLTLLNHELKEKFNIKQPRILVTGLNPHAGESGHLGKEEQDIIEPAIATLKQSGLDIDGPYPADTLFTPKYIEGSDIIVAMYHDQGLAPFKALSFGEGVNVTLGLSFLRTSVDHGTAFDIMGQGIANPNSMIEAIRIAAGEQNHGT